MHLETNENCSSSDHITTVGGDNDTHAIDDDVNNLDRQTTVNMARGLLATTVPWLWQAPRMAGAYDWVKSSSTSHGSAIELQELNTPNDGPIQVRKGYLFCLVSVCFISKS